MLRLTVVSQTEEEVVFKVEGELLGTDVNLLEEEGTLLLQGSECLILDLKGVKFIDEDGVALLERWSGNRLILRGASTFLHTLLEEYGLV